MKNKKQKVLIIFITICLLSLIIFGIISIKKFSNQNKKNNKINEVIVIDNISKFNYSLNDNATKYYKTLFEELKTILSEDNIDEEEYAKKIAQLFTADLFTLNNKLTSSDIGGVEFIYKPFKNDFISLAQNSIYSSVKNNIYGTRTQELPEVTETVIEDLTVKNFKFNEKTFENAYYVTLEIKYEKDMKYPTHYQIVLVKNEDILQVVKGQEIKKSYQ